MAMRETPQTLDPASLESSGGCRSLRHLVFETLVELDHYGRPQPLLAASWQPEPGNQRWRFLIRSGVLFHDGEAVDATAVVSSLRNANPEWKVLQDRDTIVIETGSPDPDIPAELALARNAITRPSGGQLSGTGPFAITEWDPGRHLRLDANPKYREGRPFLDEIDVEFGKSERDQLMALDLGKADVTEVGPENIGRARAQNRKVIDSRPEELMALVFARGPRSAGETHADARLSLSLDRTAMNDVVLQGGGVPAGSLLPNWLSGYAFVFSPGQEAAATQPRPQIEQGSPLRLAYDGSDPIADVISQRILLNARDRGIRMEIAGSRGSSGSDLRLVRMPLASIDPQVALGELARSVGLARPQFNTASVGELYSAEKELLESDRLIPLLHLRTAVALGPNVHGWSLLPDGTWEIENVWLSTERP
jgi:peptide/nickel transport system substrate-binding protein